MPELPEVQTTVDGLHSVLPGLIVKDVWTDYGGESAARQIRVGRAPADVNYWAGKNHIKNPDYFPDFRKKLVGQKFTGASRRGKNVLIHLSGGLTVIIHMKMTGHLLYGKYEKKGNVWHAAEKGALQEPINQFIHLVFSLSDGKCLVLSDMRKFAKVLVTDSANLSEDPELRHLGPDPLSDEFTAEVMHERLLKRPNAKIKQALMDQELIAGIGNIYSDEILWAAGVHPESRVGKIPQPIFPKMWKFAKEILKKGIRLGGDSESDYRNVYGEKGEFQENDRAYRHTGEKCQKPGCKGVIKRIIVEGRSAHFCNVHQKKYLIFAPQKSRRKILNTEGV